MRISMRQQPIVVPLERLDNLSVVHNGSLRAPLMCKVLCVPHYDVEVSRHVAPVVHLSYGTEQDRLGVWCPPRPQNHTGDKCLGLRRFEPTAGGSALAVHRVNDLAARCGAELRLHQLGLEVVIHPANALVGELWFFVRFWQLQRLSRYALVDQGRRPLSFRNHVFDVVLTKDFVHQPVELLGAELLGLLGLAVLDGDALLVGAEDAHLHAALLGQPVHRRTHVDVAHRPFAVDREAARAGNLRRTARPGDRD